MSDELIPPSVNHTCLAGAAVGSAAAGLVHAAAAGSHSGDRALALLFAMCAVAQAGWACLVAVRPSRLVALAGAGLNGAALLAWIGSRTTGLPPIDSLRDVEEVGLQDLVAASFALVALVATMLAVARPRRQVRLPPVWSVGVLAIVGVLAVPAMAAEHSHDAGHGDDHEGATDEVAHEHAEVGASAEETAAGAGHEHHDIPARLDHEPTEDQEAAASELIDETKAATIQYEDVQAATDAGYRSIGDGAGGYEHFVNAGHTASATVLEPSEPESLVYRVLPDGGRQLSTVMYILPPGSTMDDVPDIAGNLTVWHAHDNLCFAPGTTRLAGVFVDGQCRPAGIHRTSTPMLHVWVVPNDCGPFAGTDRQQATGSCVDDVAGR